MELTADFIRQTIESFFRRSEAARNAGGLALRDVMNGAPIPEGWQLDPILLYYLPPNVVLL